MGEIWCEKNVAVADGAVSAALSDFSGLWPIGWPARQRGICKKISEGLITAFKNVALMKPNRKIFCIIIGVDWQKPL